MPPNLDDVHTDDANFAQGIFDIVQLFFPNNGFNFLSHFYPLLGVSAFAMFTNIETDFFLVFGDTQTNYAIQNFSEDISDSHSENNGDGCGDQLDEELVGVAV